MAKDQSKSFSRADALRRAIRPRRSWFPIGDADATSTHLHVPRVGWGLVICVAMIAACSFLAIWTRERPLVAVGRVMDDTRVVRIGMEIPDPAATEAARDAARQRTPRVYVAEASVLDELQTSLQNLPRTLAAVQSLDQVEQGIRDQFRLTVEQLQAVQRESVNSQPAAPWDKKVQLLMAQLRVRPFLDGKTWQVFTQQSFNSEVRLVLEASGQLIPRFELINLDDQPKLAEAVGIMARDAGFSGPLRQLVVSRLTTAPKPTFRFDEAASLVDQTLAAERVLPISQKSAPGQVIFRRGDVLTAAQLDLFKAETAEFQRSAESWRVWLRRASIGAAVSAITMAIAAYAALFCPRIRREPPRMAGLAALLGAAVAVACLGTAADPGLAAVTTIVPTVFVSMILVIAYDKRVALAFGCLHGVLVCIATDQGIGGFALIVAGVGAAVWHLRELRHRNVLFKMSVNVGAVLAVGTVLMGLIDRPIDTRTLTENFTDAGLAAAGALVIGGVTLFILPLIERAFDITTGMTLVELRDPKHPLLRELQQRAPGTYNHSLNVAAIGEAAAEAVKADGLLTYVGALYHDVGKMNKPDYFVENQSGGPNKHDRLSPAMSLLVIVGHVKDGLELAREFGIPRNLQHFIESHHGSTLVEYFYHRALQQAELAAGDQAREESKREGREPGPDDGEETQVPAEFEYRYPGPRPRTKEAAIVMLSDSVESAARTLAEPTPSRIDALVRTLANKRLMDGQFDDCEMTLRDLNLIAESIAKSLTSIYHGRITYKSTDSRTQKRA